MTGDYSFEDGNGGSRDQYLKDNNITTYLITSFNDIKIFNNNEDDMKLEKKMIAQGKKKSLGSPVLNVANLPKIFVTNFGSEESCETWSPEIPFENLTPEVAESEILGNTTLGEF